MSYRIEPHGGGAIPVPGGAAPAPWIGCFGLFVERLARHQDSDVGPFVTLSRRDEFERRVAVLGVVPAHELQHPRPHGFQRLEALPRIAGVVFEGAEEGFGLGVVVRDARAAERRRNAELLQGRQHRGPLHRAAVVRMQYHLVRRDFFSHANIAHDVAGQFTAFCIINLPANDFAAKNIDEQIQVK